MQNYYYFDENRIICLKFELKIVNLDATLIAFELMRNQTINLKRI